MKTSVSILALLLGILALCSSARATEPEPRGTGIGIILGEPTGFSVKHWTGSSNAIDGAVAWSFAKGSSFHIHADYLWHAFDAIPESRNLPVYFGVGGRLKAGSNDNNGSSSTRLGVRGVVGLDLLLQHAPVDIFIEIAPIMDFAPSTELGFNGGLGFRVWLQ